MAYTTWESMTRFTVATSGLIGIARHRSTNPDRSSIPDISLTQIPLRRTSRAIGNRHEENQKRTLRTRE